MPDPLELWRSSLADWGIPEAILASAPRSPWQLPPGLFAERADAQIARPRGRSLARAGEALAPRGTILDVGAGGGAASLPLHALIEHMHAVDQRADMLSHLRVRADRLGVPATTVEGTWPDIGEQVPIADVVVCSHVLYNVAELGPFALGLAGHARRRVVLEITAQHPVSGLNPLWHRFHGLARPDRPNWEDAATALTSLGLRPTVERWQRPSEATGSRSYAELVDLTSIRLCLPVSRIGELAEALKELGVDPAQPRTWNLSSPEVVTLWWDR